MVDRSFVGEGLPFNWQSQRLSVHHLTQPFELSYKVNTSKSHILYRKRLTHREEMLPDQAGTQSRKMMKISYTDGLHVF